MEAKYMNSRFGLLSLCGAINRRMTEQYIERLGCGVRASSGRAPAINVPDL